MAKQSHMWVCFKSDDNILLCVKFPGRSRRTRFTRCKNDPLCPLSVLSWGFRNKIMVKSVTICAFLDQKCKQPNTTPPLKQLCPLSLGQSRWLLAWLSADVHLNRNSSEINVPHLDIVLLSGWLIPVSFCRLWIALATYSTVDHTRKIRIRMWKRQRVGGSMSTNNNNKKKWHKSKTFCQSLDRDNWVRKKTVWINMILIQPSTINNC